jgi:hypothetical protein
MIKTTYSGRTIRWYDAEPLILAGKGRYLIFVVEEPLRKTRELKLKHGLFFEDENGDLWDVVFTTLFTVKSFANVANVFEDLERTAGTGWGITLPFLKAAHVFRPGGNRPEVFGRVVPLGVAPLGN